MASMCPPKICIPKNYYPGYSGYSTKPSYGHPHSVHHHHHHPGKYPSIPPASNVVYPNYSGYRNYYDRFKPFNPFQNSIGKYDNIKPLEDAYFASLDKDYKWNMTSNVKDWDFKTTSGGGDVNDGKIFLSPQNVWVKYNPSVHEYVNDKWKMK
jgi:hypothetical protein